MMLRRLLVGFAFAAAVACQPRSPLPFESGPRFTALGDATVQDNRFKLVWSGNANLPDVVDAFGGLTWSEALEFVAQMNAGSRPNLGHTDWRLPHVEDLLALTSAFWVPGSALACGLDGFGGSCVFRAPFDPFTSVVETCYWSGTMATAHTWDVGRGAYLASDPTATRTPDSSDVWAIDLRAKPFPLSPTARCGVWPVRGPWRVVAQGGDPTGSTTGSAKSQVTVPIVVPVPLIY